MENSLTVPLQNIKLLSLNTNRDYESIHLFDNIFSDLQAPVHLSECEDNVEEKENMDALLEEKPSPSPPLSSLPPQSIKRVESPKVKAAEPQIIMPLVTFQYSDLDDLSCSINCYLESYREKKSYYSGDEHQNFEQCVMCNTNEIIQTEKIQSIAEWRKRTMDSVRLLR